MMKKNENTPMLKYYRIESIPGLEFFRSDGDTRCVSRHVHELFCLSIVEIGVRICQTKKDKEYLIPGTVFVSNRGEAHSGSVPEGQQCSCRSIRLTPERWQLVLNEMGYPVSDDIYFPRPRINDRKLFQAIRRYHRAAGQPASTLHLENSLFEIIAHLLQYSASPLSKLIGRGKEAGLMSLVCDYLHEFYAENISLQKISEIADLSPYYLCRLFEKEIGVPLHVYQLDIRLTKAAQMLAKGQRIADVAAETGFFDQSHFHKAFSRKFGLTPKQYRQN